MTLPFTVEEFLAVFTEYNQRVFPLQLVLYCVAALAIYAAIGNRSWKDQVISGILAIFWLWMGMVYHVMFFATINKAAYFFGGLFVVQGVLFFHKGVINHQMCYRLQRNIYGLISSVLVVFSLLIYPLISHFLGHEYPATPTFGLPCPTTIFTFGMLLLLDNKYPKIVLIIPLIWAIIGFSAAFLLGIREDLSLLIAAIVSIGLIIVRDRKLRSGFEV